MVLYLYSPLVQSVFLRMKVNLEYNFFLEKAIVSNTGIKDSIVFAVVKKAFE